MWNPSCKWVSIFLPGPGPLTCSNTSVSICLMNLFANSSSVNLFEDKRALRRQSSVSLSERAFSNPSANSVAVVAWKPSIR